MPAVTAKRADIIGKPARARRDEIGERHVGAAFAAGKLLAQRMQLRRSACPALRRQKPECRRPRCSPATSRPRRSRGTSARPRSAAASPARRRRGCAPLRRQLGRRESSGYLPLSSQVAKNGVQSMKSTSSAIRHVCEADACRGAAAPAADNCPDQSSFNALARASASGSRLALLAARVRRGDACIFGADFGDSVGSRLGREQLRDHADGAARIVDIDGLAAAVVRDESSPPYARGWSSRRRSGAGCRSPAAPSRRRRGTSRRATA